MRKIIISEEFDPYFNIAAEYQLFLAAEEDIHLYLWQNDASVIVGRNQNLYAECDLGYLAEQGIKAVRRLSGGGAVYHDRGNVNFTFIMREVGADPRQFVDLIRSAMLGLGIACEFSGRNDLLYQGQKFSGHAYYAEDGNYMYHGTVLVDVDFGQLGRALTPSKLKLQSKGVASVKSRVVNLSQIDRAITTHRVMGAFVEAFGGQDIQRINRSNFAAPLEPLLSSYDWLYGQSPNFDVVVEKKYPFGTLSVSAAIADGLVRSAKIHTDSLQPYDFTACQAGLVGKPFDEARVLSRLDEYLLGLPNLS